MVISSNISLFLGNDTRYGHSGTPIRTRMRSMQYEHFQWPWMAPNSCDFQTGRHFDVEYWETVGLQDTDIVTLECYHRHLHTPYSTQWRIHRGGGGGGERSMQYEHFQWPWMTPNSYDFQTGRHFDVEYWETVHDIQTLLHWNAITDTYTRPTQHSGGSMGGGIWRVFW